ncbi:MAG: hypothetical protein KDK11_14630 [Maritimibacter sp.]|nr:hypothetical protein [Maritimibacter sp.]
MTFLLLSMGLVAATLWVARPVLVGGGLRINLDGVDGRGVLGTFAAVSAAALVLGVEYAIGLLAAALVKSAGHLVGHRLVGDADAEFRLVPFPGGPEAAGATPRDDLGAFFILLMGPGLGLAPMVAAFALGHVFAEPAPALAESFRAYALAAGALNFVSLLPLWPLAGGRLVQLMVEARFPRVTGLAAAALAAMFVGMSLTMQSMMLFLIGLVAALALVVRPPQSTPRPCLTRKQTRIGFLAYFVTLAAYFTAGWWVLTL